MNPLRSDLSSEYQEKLRRAAEALEGLEPHNRVGSRLFAALNRMGSTSSVIVALLQENSGSGKMQVLLQLRPKTEVWPDCWGLPASALNADESKREVIERMLTALGCTLVSAVELYGAEWYMSPTSSPFVDPVQNERGSYYHYPFYVVYKGKPIAGEKGWHWWNVDSLPDESTWVVHHIRGALFPVLQYRKNRDAYEAGRRQMLAALGIEK